MAIQLKGDDTSTYSSSITLGASASAPTITLNASGSASFGGGEVTITDTETNFGDIFSSDGGTRILSRGELYIRQDNAAFGVMTVSKGGTAGSDQTFSLTANGDVKTGTFDSSSNGVAGIELGVLGACSVQRVNGSADGATLFIGYRGNDNQFFVTANGNISARNTSISQIGSERRLKNTIEPLDPVRSWETIRDLPYYSYKLNENGDSTYYGPIVDECPEELIVEGATSDEEGNIRTYDNSLLQGRLFVALQTALTRIEALEAQLTQLTGGAS